MNSLKKAKNLGPIYMIASSFFFALMAVFIRYTKDLPTFEQVVFRNFVISILMFLLIVKEKRIHEMKVRDGKKEIFYRSLFGFIGMVCNFYAVKYLNIADASAIGKLSPFFVMIFAALILRERLERHSIIAIILSILGMLMVVKPKFDGSTIPSLVALTGAMTAGLAMVMLSSVGKKVRGEVIILYFGIFSTLACIPFLVGHFVIPNETEILNLLMIGVSAGFGQFFLTLAYKSGKATEIAIYSFSQIIFSIFIGYFLFNERTDLISLTGMAIIILSAYYNYKRSIVYD